MSAITSAANAGRTLRDIAPLLYIGGAAVLVFFAYRAFKSLQLGIAPAVDAIAAPVADAIVGLTHDPVRIADASKWITLPSGQRITWDQVIAAGSSLKSDNTFYWQGVRYLVTGRGSDGAWQTKLH